MTRKKVKRVQARRKPREPSLIKFSKDITKLGVTSMVGLSAISMIGTTLKAKKP